MADIKKTFFEAIDKKDTHIIAELLNVNPSLIDEVDSNGNSVLKCACYKHDVDNIVKLLLLMGAKCTCNELHIAAYKGNYELFELLLPNVVNPLALDDVKVEHMTLYSTGVCACSKVKCSDSPKTFNVESVSKNPLLCSAVKGGNLLIIDKVLDISINNINIEDDQGRTALEIACYREPTEKYPLDRSNFIYPQHNLDIVKLLVERGADINHRTALSKPLVNYYDTRDLFGCSALHFAIKKVTRYSTYTICNHEVEHIYKPKFDLEIRQNLEEGRQNYVEALNIIDNYQMYIEETSTHKNDDDMAIIRYLLDRGASIDTSTKTYESPYIPGYSTSRPLYPSSLIGDAMQDLDIAMMLYDKVGSDVLRTYKLNYLHHIAYNGDTVAYKHYFRTTPMEDVTKDILSSNYKFKTPLHVAVSRGHITLVKLMIDTCKPSLHLESLLERAISYKQYHVVKFLSHYCDEKIDYTKLLLLAIKNKDLLTIKLLFEGKYIECNVDSDNDIIKTAWATHNYTIIKYLLDRGVSPNIQTYPYSLLFDMYNNNSHIHIVKLLLDHKLDLTAKNDRGETIMDSLIDNLKYANKMRCETLLLLLSTCTVTFNLSKLKENLKDADTNIYNQKEIRCAADESYFDWALCRHTYFPQIVAVIKNNYKECHKCKTYNAINGGYICVNCDKYIYTMAKN